MKKGVIIILIVLLIAAIISGIVIWLNINDTKKQDEVFKNYIALINEQNYEEMYEMISKSSKSEISKENFVKRNKNIYEGIDAVNVNIEITNKEKENGNVKISYNETMGVSAGTIEFSNAVTLVKEHKEYKIDWSSSLIFPELAEKSKVRVSTLEASRGEILDRNGNKLAENGTISSVGIVPGKLGDNKEEGISKISDLTGVSVDFINKQISASYVKDDTFVPIKKVAKNNTELKEKLLQIPGVMITNVDSRVYPLGKEAAQLIGYVQTINADELKEKAGKGYSSTSLIGKSGLELAYEDTLRGIDGKEIYIEDENGNKIKQLAIQNKKDGTDIKLTIDSKLQSQIYNQMKDDKGLFVVMDPSTGELLATVSTPSYDSNDFVLGMTNAQWEELNNNEAKPLYNRVLQTYCPGSTFKPITAAIGLTTGKIATDTEFNYSGLSWQKDSSWGNNFITTLTSYSGKKNVANALIYSDNIFFAQSALQIGSQTFCEGLDKLGFNEQVEFPLTLKKSQYANSGKITDEKKLADSGYGQGDILVNPIHMASIYSAFVNGGNMVKPYIIYDESKKKEYIKENVFSQEAVNEVKQDLIQVVENPNGTANDMKITGHTIAGKTGTAELKKSLDDTESGTLGWFNCFTIDEASGNNMLIISMVENTQNNSRGGSHYLINKIRNLF